MQAPLDQPGPFIELRGREWELLDILGHCGHEVWQLYMGRFHWDNVAPALGLWEKGLIRMLHVQAKDDDHYSLCLTEAGIEQVRWQRGYICEIGPRPNDYPEHKLPAVKEMSFNPESVRAFNRGDLGLGEAD